MTYSTPSDYLRPLLTVDLVVLGYHENELHILLVKRLFEPYIGRWALPGGFVLNGETLREAAFRELKEETGVGHIRLDQLMTFDEVERDPRERIITVAFLALVKSSQHMPVASGDAVSAKWMSLKKLVPLAFDHKKFLTAGVSRLRDQIRKEPIVFDILPPEFTLTQLQTVYEDILGEKLDKRNFRKKILGMEILKETDIKIKTPYRTPQLYKFDKALYKKRISDGFKFDL